MVYVYFLKMINRSELLWGNFHEQCLFDRSCFDIEIGTVLFLRLILDLQV